MNKTSLITSATGIALLLATALPALAEDNVTASNDATVQSSVNVEAHEGENSSGLGVKRPLFNLHMFASTTARLEANRAAMEMKKASTTARIEAKRTEMEAKKASTTEKHIEKAQDKAGSAIDMRIKSLQELSTRLGTMKLLPAETLATIQASIAAEIQTLVDLKAKIGSDTASTTLKADAKSITQEHRVFLLVEPKARIASAASRVNAVVTQFQALAVKLQARITLAAAAGADVTASTATLADFNAKIADAKVNADAALAETVNLQADNGNATVLAANTAALKDAKAKLEVAQKDLAAARADAAKIYGVVKGKEGKGQGVENSNSTTTETH